MSDNGQEGTKILTLKERMALLNANSSSGSIPIPSMATPMRPPIYPSASTSSNLGQQPNSERNTSNASEINISSNLTPYHERSDSSSSLNSAHMTRPIISASRRKPSSTQFEIPDESKLSKQDVEVFDNSSNPLKRDRDEKEMVSIGRDVLERIEKRFKQQEQRMHLLEDEVKMLKQELTNLGLKVSLRRSASVEMANISLTSTSIVDSDGSDSVYQPSTKSARTTTENEADGQNNEEGEWVHVSNDESA